MNHLSIIADKINETVINNPKIAVAAPAITFTLGQVQSVLSTISMVIGIFVSLYLCRHWWVKVQIAEMELEAKKKAQL
jgi:uncharacterized membrane protein YciS (DUF1049 family)